MEIWDILRRWHDGQTISIIATSIGPRAGAFSVMCSAKILSNCALS
jgi:hypothetical protein